MLLNKKPLTTVKGFINYLIKFRVFLTYIPQSQQHLIKLAS